MALLVRCTHCGAPHRAVSARERFTCDYCRGLNVLSGAAVAEELVCPVPARPGRAVEALRRAVEARGVLGAVVRAHEPTWLALWQVVSAEGEEHLVAATLRRHPVSGAGGLPALPLVSRSEADPAPPGRVEVDRVEAEQAALAAFEEADPVLEHVRLLWIPVVPVEARARGRRVQGLWMEGAGRLVLEPLPRGMEDLPLRRDLLALLLGHALLCGLAGALLPGLVERLVVLSLLCAGGWLGFRLLHGKGAPA